ncbi:MAG: hemerythrin domain-containing protein [Magnetococcales bacterium]|nr:hemerythrin domain-containing protein [Magnetococcales bacterium]
MEPFPWNAKFAIGVELVDLQHRYFLDLINRVWDGFSLSEDEVYQRRLIQELRKYAEFHFLSEENLAYSLGLPHLSLHHERHMELLGELDRRTEAVLREGADAEEFFMFLISWFSGHTYYEDRILFAVRET